jgi:hypothetical protein
MKFATNEKTCINLNIGYDNKTVEEVLTAKFLGLQIDNNLNWKKHRAQPPITSSLNSKYFPKHPVFKQPQVYVLS